MTRSRPFLPCALLFAACTAVPEVVDVEATDPAVIATAATPRIPDATVPATPQAPGVEIVSNAPRLQLLAHASGGGCDHEVVAHGFPAIGEDGRAIAFVQHHDSAGADFGGPMTIETRRIDDSVIASTPVADGEAIYEATDGEWNKACRTARAEIQQRVDAINATFASGWRPMTRVAVQPPWRVEGAPELPELGDDRHARPVEALYHAGHFVARVRGVKVLQSSPIPSWRGEEPEMTMDATEPTVVALYHDAATGRAVAELSYESASCMSDPNIYTRALDLAPAVVAAATDRAAYLVADPSDAA